MALRHRNPGIRPRQTLGIWLDHAARAGFPATCTVLTMLLTQAPFGIPGQAVVLPAVTLACVWFWSLFRPAAMPPVAVFGIGLLLDLLGYTPLGVGVLVLLLAHGIARRGRRFLGQQGFAMNWLAFVPVGTGAALLSWGLVVALTLRLLSPGMALFQAVLTGALYPVLAIPLAWAHRSVPEADAD
jgi:rod shape-determining protein MreD